MIVLDTNVVSELIRPAGEARVVTWVDSYAAGDLFLTAVTTAELRYGLARLPHGRRKSELTERVLGVLEQDFTERILVFDDNAAARYAEIVVERERRGLAVSMADAQIAAICRNHGAVLATRNTKDFTHTGVKVIDPWRSAV